MHHENVIVFHELMAAPGLACAPVIAAAASAPLWPGDARSPPSLQKGPEFVLKTKKSGCPCSLPKLWSAASGRDRPENAA